MQKNWRKKLKLKKKIFLTSERKMLTYDVKSHLLGLKGLMFWVLTM